LSKSFELTELPHHYERDHGDGYADLHDAERQEPPVIIDVLVHSALLAERGLQARPSCALVVHEITCAILLAIGQPPMLTGKARWSAALPDLDGAGIVAVGSAPSRFPTSLVYFSALLGRF
jgi:hypothetical protein